jgi:FKBP-type peptidyl-prolyl cis-trans isomerase (trigger factor)
MHSLSHQGISKAHYLQISGKTEEELVEESKPDAEVALRREAVLAAIIEAEQIEPTEAQLLDALESAAEKEQMSRQKLLDRLRSAGRLDMLVKEVAAEQAIDLVVTTAKPVAPDAAEKKKAKADQKKDKPGAKKKPAATKKAPAKQQGDKGDELWTPGADPAAAGAKGKLWTPDS